MGSNGPDIRHRIGQIHRENRRRFFVPLRSACLGKGGRAGLVGKNEQMRLVLKRRHNRLRIIPQLVRHKVPLWQRSRGLPKGVLAGAVAGVPGLFDKGIKVVAHGPRVTRWERAGERDQAGPRFRQSDVGPTTALQQGMNVTLADIVAARQRLRGGVYETPCQESAGLSELLGCRIYCKLEFQQRTGSFKERGARNALLQLSADRRARGVIAASAGNHALAMAFHGRDLGIPVTVVMPRIAPLIKQTRCKSFGARVMIAGENIAEAKETADGYVEREGLTYVHGFDGAEVIAGQGTIGLEILDQVPDVDAIVIPVGGAGLIAGVGRAVKALKPSVEIIGVEPERASSLYQSLAAGKPVKAAVKPTLADGLAVPEVGARAFAISKEVVDRVVLVEEESIALAILRLIELEKGVVEGGGAAPLAAMLAGKLPELVGKRVVLVLCGGNIDPNVLGRVIDHGLVADGRVTQFTAVIPDRPGGLAALTAAIARAGASVQEINHERAFAGADVSTVQVVCTVEVRDANHIDELHAELERNGLRVISRTSPLTCAIRG